jgi:hypothetical protein
MQGIEGEKKLAFYDEFNVITGIIYSISTCGTLKRVEPFASPSPFLAQSQLINCSTLKQVEPYASAPVP